MRSRSTRRRNLDQFNFMVAGPSRLGKSAFLRTFFRTLDVSAVSSEERCPVASDFDYDTTTRINQVSVVVDEAGERFGLTMVDTPGFVDDGTVEDQCRLLVAYLENQFDARLIEESRVRRNPKALNRQLHACLYFVDPAYAGLRAVDILIIRNLSARVNVIPVLAKADTLTLERQQRVKRAIRRDIRNNRLNVYRFPDFDDVEIESDDESDGYEISARGLRRLVPFSVLAMEEDTLLNGTISETEDSDYFEESFLEDEEEDDFYEDSKKTTHQPNGNSINETNNNYIKTNGTTKFDSITKSNDQEQKGMVLLSPRAARNSVKSNGKTNDVFLGRRYPWGNIDVMNPAHCDVSPLRTALLSTQRRLLRDTTIEVLYERYRTEQLRERRAEMLAVRRSIRTGTLPALTRTPLMV